MPSFDKNRSAGEVVQRRLDFQNALSANRKYPVQEFKSFADAARRYIKSSEGDPLIHRSVAAAINGLTDFLAAERKRVPGDILCAAQRLESLLFSEYNPHFEGDEPPSL